MHNNSEYDILFLNKKKFEAYIIDKNGNQFHAHDFD